VLLLPVPSLVTPSSLACDKCTSGGDGSAATVAMFAAYVRLGGLLWTSFRTDIKDRRSQICSFESRLAALAGWVCSPACPPAPLSPLSPLSLRVTLLLGLLGLPLGLSLRSARRFPAVF
jgi:hypothetical protein